MDKHKFILGILFFLIYIVAIANSFFSEVFIEPLISDFSLSQLVNGIFLVVFVIYNFFNSDAEYWKFSMPLLLLSLYGLISSIWSPFPFVAIVFSLKLLFVVNVFVLTANLARRNLLTDEKLVVLAKAVILITVVGQIIGRLLGINTYNSEFSTAGLSDNVSTIAGQLLFALPAIFIGNFRKKTDFIYIFLILFSNVFTLRRSTLLSLLLVLAIVFILIFFSSSSSIRKKLRWVFFSIGFIISFIYVLISTQIGLAFLSRLSDLNPSQGGTASGRYDFQHLGLIYSIKRDLFSMFFGGGFGDAVRVNVINGFKPIGMHSDLLDIFIGLGILGFFLYLWFIKRIWLQTRKLSVGNPYFNGSISFLVALVSLGIFSGGFFEMKTMLGYMSFGLIYGAYPKILKL